ncbi:MAG: phosphoribosylanthranilate isomerase [Kiritimatiellia bacterium]
MTRLKICGVRTVAFARAAERLGADYLGLIFAPESPRAVTVARARAVVAALAGTARPVGVFTDASVEAVADACAAAGIGIVQLHRRARREEVVYLRGRGLEVWTLGGGAPGDAVVFDSSHGDGERALVFGPYRTVLAGGISADNVCAAFASGADVIDVSGSLESSPGRKSSARLRAFVRVWNSLLARKEG